MKKHGIGLYLRLSEASLDTAFDDIEELGYSIIKSKGYKTNKHVFLKRADASA